VETINLIDIGIKSDVRHDMTNLLPNLPQLKYLYLNSNFLKSIPIFFNQNLSSSSYNFSSIYFYLRLTKNLISTFTYVDSQVLCRVMPNFNTLIFDENRLVEVTGVSVCKKLRYLSLAYNNLGQKSNENFRAISQLSRLKHLDLTDNQLTYIPNYLFDNMTELAVLMLAKNSITTLPTNFSIACPKLIILNLESNALSTLDASDLKGLSLLALFYIQDNYITSFSKETLDSFEYDFKKLTLFAFNKNPFVCQCDNYFGDWLNVSSIQMITKDVTCSPPEANNRSLTVKVIDYTPDKFFCFIKVPLIYSGIVVAGILVSLMISLPCYKYRWYISHCRVVVSAVIDEMREVKFEEHCVYDALVSYNTQSEEDTRWVVENLVPGIEHEDVVEINKQNDVSRVHGVIYMYQASQTFCMKSENVKSACKKSEFINSCS